MAGSGLIISTRLDPVLSDEFVETCNRTGRERSEVLRTLIKDWIDGNREDTDDDPR